MKISTLAFGATLALFGSTYGSINSAYAADNKTVGEIIDDASITASVKAALLADNRTEGFDINVDTSDGNVSLRGGADSYEDSRAASDIAKGVSGVREVRNELIVAKAGTETRMHANEATASGEVRAAAEGAGASVDDAWITSKVTSQFLVDTRVAGLKIDVDTKDNRVQLSGVLASTAQRTAAIEIATATRGVKSVDASNLVVR